MPKSCWKHSNIENRKIRYINLAWHHQSILAIRKSFYLQHLRPYHKQCKKCKQFRWWCYLHLDGIFILTFYFFWFICFHNKMFVDDFYLIAFSSLGEICTLPGWCCLGILKTLLLLLTMFNVLHGEHCLWWTTMQWCISSSNVFCSDHRTQIFLM